MLAQKISHWDFISNRLYKPLKNNKKIFCFVWCQYILSEKRNAERQFMFQLQ